MKCTKIDFGWGKTPLGELKALPMKTYGCNRGDLLLREGEGCGETEEVGEEGGKEKRKGIGRRDSRYQS